MDFENGRRMGPTIWDIFSRPLADFDQSERYARPERERGYDAVALDVIDAGSAYIVQADLPGTRKEDIALDFEDGVLSIKAVHHQHSASEARYLLQERSAGTYLRRLAFEDADSAGIEAAFDQGVLTVTLPKLSRTQTRSGIEIR